MKSIRKTLLTLSLVAASFAAQAISLTVGDDYYLGWIQGATPSDAGTEVSFINTLVGLGLNGSATIIQPGPDPVVTRSGNLFVSLPTAEEADNGGQINNTEIDLGDGWAYVYGKYGNDAFVWYVAGLTGTIDIPGTVTGSGGLSHRSLYNPGGGEVPDGGMTVALLGMGLFGLATVRRSFAR